MYTHHVSSGERAGPALQPGELSSGLCGDSGMGRGCGREFPAGGDIGLHIPGSLVVKQKRTQHCKAIILRKKNARMASLQHSNQ